ncbi:MAG: acyltransferase [Clostridia bacterium]|nr:acyltransferase [Clostridia bacterium]
MSKTKRNYIFIDLLRAIAAFCVIVNHTNSDIFLTNAPPSPRWFLSLAYFFFSKIAVPVFIMITGYLMLDKPISYRKTLFRALRIGAVILIFSVPYYIVQCCTGKIVDGGILHFLQTVFSSRITTAYWYLYQYLGILLMLPFIQKMAENFTRRDFYIFFAMGGLLNSVWPLLVHFFPALSYSKFFTLPGMSIYLMLLLIGLYFKRYPPHFPHIRAVYLCTVFLGVLLNVLLTWREFIVKNGTGYLFYDKRELFPILLPSVAVFGLCSTLSFRERPGRLITFLGSLTFGIYLMSDLLIDRFKFLYQKAVAGGLHPLLAVVLFELLVFAAGGAVTWLLKKIPLLKKLL